MKFTKRRKEHIAKTLIDFGKLTAASLVLSQFIGDKRFNVVLFVSGIIVAVTFVTCGVLVDDSEE